MPGTITIAGLIAGLPSGQKTVGPNTYTGSSTIDESRTLALTSGDNTVTVPTGASAVLIIPPATNANLIKLRTNLNSADGGLQLLLTGPQFHTFPSGTTSLILNAAGSVAGLDLTFV